MISSAKSFCASFTSVSVISSKCFINSIHQGNYAIDGEKFLHAWKVTDSCIEGGEAAS